MKKAFFAVLWFLTVGVVVNNVSAQETPVGGIFENFGVALKAGTYGIGLDVSTSLHPNIKARLGYNYFGYKYTAGLNYDADGVSGNDVPVAIDNAEIRFPNANLLIDYFPMPSGIFHLTAGLYFGQTKLSINGSAPEAFYVNDYVIKPNIDDSYSAHLKLGNTVKPYFGIGLGRTIPKSSVGFKFELGVLYHGPYKIESDNVDNFAVADADKSKLPELVDIVITKFWPMMTFSLSYRIN